VYVDDGRITAPTQELAWVASSRFAKINAALGLQDAARKRRAPAQDSGPWTGGIVWGNEGSQVIKTCSQERWEKTKGTIHDLRVHFEESKHRTTCKTDSRILLDHKLLQVKGGILTLMSRTFTDLVPYLKGIHLTIDSW